MKVQDVYEVVNKALSDVQFASQLEALARASAEKGFGSVEWGDFFAFFAKDPQDLARLRAVHLASEAGVRLAPGVEPAMPTLTTLTLTTITSAACTCTTTTTTTTTTY